MAPKKVGKGKKVGKSKKVAPAPAALLATTLSSSKKSSVQKEKKPTNPLFEKRPRDTAGKPKRDWAKRDLTRYTKWPRYISLQRQKALLMQRLKIPPPIYQFNKKQALDAHKAREVIALLHKYRPESRVSRRRRLKMRAAAQLEGKDTTVTKKVIKLRQGINKVTTLIEQKKAKLVVIAHDVDPIEIVVFLPALCRKMGVPYCIIKSKARLGTVVRRKTVTAVCLTDVNADDKATLNKIIESSKEQFNDRFDDIRKNWGGGALSRKAIARKSKIEKAKIKEIKKAEKASTGH